MKTKVVIVVTERERLIGLINQKQDGGSKYGDNILHETKCSNAELADYLLANGVHITACATCEYIKYTKEKGMLIELMGKPIKYCPECGEKLE